MKHLETYSDETLNGAIKQLKFNRQWASRLDALIQEKQRREKLKRKTI